MMLKITSYYPKSAFADNTFIGFKYELMNSKSSVMRER